MIRLRLGTALVVLSSSFVAIGAAGLLLVDRAEAASDGLRVLSARSGREVWRATPPRGAFFDVSSGTETMVALSGTCLSSGDGIADRQLVALNARNGDERWVSEGSNLVGTVGGASMNRLGSDAVTVPVDASGIVVVIPTRSSPHHTIGLDARSGRVRWTMRSQAFAASSSLVFAQGLAAGPTPDQPAPGVDAFDRMTGTLRWTFGIHSDPQWSKDFQIVAADDQRVVVLNRGFRIRSDGAPEGLNTFFVLDAQTGTELSRFDGGDPAVTFSNFSITDGAVVYAEDASVLARDLATGNVRWQQNLDQTQFPASTSNAPTALLAAASDGQTVFAYNENQTNALIAIDAQSGETRWSLTGLRFRSADGRSTVLSTPDEPSRLAVYDTTTGSPRWDRRLEQDGNVALGGTRIATTPACDMR